MTTPLTWINDRLPTEEDGDCDGDVVVLGPCGSGWFALSWDLVGSDQFWLPFTPPIAAPTPEPAAFEPAPPAAPVSQPRRIVSLTRTVYGAVHIIDAVADDGTAWWKVPGEVEWTQLPALPQREDDPAAGKVP